MLEWDPIELATADLRSLALYRNGAKAGAIPRPRDVTATKISGLAVDHEYTFQLVLRTSAGTHASAKLVARTHKMTDLSGITVTPGILPPQLRHALSETVERIGGKLVEGVRIDTTHFVCTEGRGRDWERAVEMNIPVVRPEWVEGCEREGRIVGVRGYYLNADPKLRQIGPGVMQHQQQRQRTESGAGAPRVPSTSSGTELGTARGSPQMAVPPVSGRTDISGVSPMGTVGNGARMKEPSVPPTPPAKDTRQRPAAALESDSRDASVSPVDGASAEEEEEEEEDDDEDEEDEEPNGSKARAFRSPGTAGGIAQSPFDSAQKEQDMPYRGGPVEDAKKREPSDGGSFSEVAL